MQEVETMNDDDMLITGLGVISAAGGNLKDTLKSFANGQRNAGPVSLFPTALQYPVLKYLGFRDDIILQDNGLSAWR